MKFIKNEEDEFMKKIRAFTIELHERDQSLALKKIFHWSHSIYLKFQQNKE